MDNVAAVAADYKRQLLGLLELRPGLSVRDLGCGPGTDLPAVADAVTTSGRVVGVDIDPRMVDAASTRFHGRPHLEVLLGDGHALPFEDATFDRARMDRALQHITDPAAVLAELLRVLKPGGLLRIGEPDWDSTVVDGDLEMNRVNRFICSTMVPQRHDRPAARPARQAGGLRGRGRPHRGTCVPRLRPGGRDLRLDPQHGTGDPRGCHRARRRRAVAG